MVLARRTGGRPDSLPRRAPRLGRLGHATAAMQNGIVHDLTPATPLLHPSGAARQLGCGWAALRIAHFIGAEE